MGRYVNPGNEGFRTITAVDYVDKTGLVALFDSTLNTSKNLVMVSRPRRFGKSFAAQAVSAFYSCGCDSRALFEGLEVSRREGWDANLNRFNVVRLDMAVVIGSPGESDIASKISGMVLSELCGLLPDERPVAGTTKEDLLWALFDATVATGRKFVFVIDEWDAPYRLAKSDSALQDEYAEWLRSLFKNANFTAEVVAGAYLTGILPIKKYAHQSAVSDFREYTMVRPGPYVEYVGVYLVRGATTLR